jgi:hypothetical protein
MMVSFLARQKAASRPTCRRRPNRKSQGDVGDATFLPARELKLIHARVFPGEFLGEQLLERSVEPHEH